jgi:hypothetical protein
MTDVPTVMPLARNPYPIGYTDFTKDSGARVAWGSAKDAARKGFRPGAEERINIARF